MEMYSHAEQSNDFQIGYREGLEEDLSLVEDLIGELKADSKPYEASWIEVARDWIDSEIFCFELGGEG